MDKEQFVNYNISKQLWLIFILFIFSNYTFSATQYLKVGESYQIPTPNPVSSTGYIDGAYIISSINTDYLEVNTTNVYNVYVKVKKYFQDTATFKVRFVEKYTYNGHIDKVDHDVEVSIACKYIKPTKVTLPSSLSLMVGEKKDITYTVEPEGASITNISWTRYHGSTNLVIEPFDGGCSIVGRQAGQGSVTVTLNDDDNLSARTNVDVWDPDNYPPSAVSLPISKEISVGGHVTLIPTLTPSNASTKYTWTSNNPSVAEVEYGKVIGVSLGTATITVKTTNNLTATCTITVVPNNGKDNESDQNYTGAVDGYEYVDLGLTVKWAVHNVGASKPEDFGGYYAWGETTEKSTYSRSNYTASTSIVTDIKETSNDVAYVKWSKKWRMPTEAEFREMISKCNIKVETFNGIEGFRVTGPNGASIFIPNSGHKENSSYYHSSINHFCMWTSTPGTNDVLLKAYWFFYDSRNGFATNNNGNRWAGLPIRPVTAYSGNQPIGPTSITLPSSKTMKVGETFTMTYTLSPSNATTTLTWTSDDTGIATVSSAGVVKGIKAGTTKIRVQTANGKTDWCNVTVEASSVDPTSITLPYSKTVKVGETFTMTYTLSPSNATTTLTWSSDDTSIATVSSAGVVKGIKAGTTKIRVQTANGKTDWCNVTVEASSVDPTSITLPYSKTVKVGETFTMTYTLSPSNATTTLTWTSDDTSIATVSSAGVVKGIKIGSTYINVKTANGKTDYCKVIVEANNGDGTLANPFNAIGASQKASELAIGETSTQSYYVKGIVSSIIYYYSAQYGTATFYISDNGGTTTNQFYVFCAYYLENRPWVDGNPQIAIGDNLILYGKLANYEGTFEMANKENYIYSHNGKTEIGNGSYSIKLSNDGYATFYDSKLSYTLPSGLTAQVVNNVSNNKLTYKTTSNIPKGTAVMLKGNSSQTYVLTATENVPSYSGTNLLRGSDVATTTTGNGYHYKLSYGQSGTNLSNVFGWYWGAANGGSFQIEGHKAWLVIPKSSAARSFTIEGDATGIASVNSDEKEAILYDLQGRRLNDSCGKGIYIKNGKKVIIK